MKEQDMNSPVGEEAFADILQQYEKMVFNICYSMTRNYFDAEDLSQETFIALYKALPNFDGENLGGYITRIATNKCLDHLKGASQRVIPTEADILSQQETAVSGPEEVLVEREVEEELRKACIGLKSPYSQVALAYYCQGETAAQIAERTGKKTKTVQTQIRRAKGMLQKRIRKEDTL